MAKRKSSWSKMIEEAGFRIRIYERPNGAAVYFSFIIDGKKTQRPHDVATGRKPKSLPARSCAWSLGIACWVGPGP